MKPATGFVLGALCVGALGIAGPSTASHLAREFITLHPGDTLAPHYAVLTDTVLTVAPGKIIAKHCGTSKAFLRFWKLRPATHDSVITNGDSVTVSVTGTTTQPCVAEAPVPAPIDTTFTVFAATDFESGTIAPFYDPWKNPADLNVVADSTNSGHGKILRIRYYNDPANGWIDNNHGITLDANYAPAQITYGNEVIFTGDLYLQKGATDSLISATGLRKLNYWCSNDTNWSTNPTTPQNHFCFVLSTQSNGPGVASGVEQFEWSVTFYATQPGSVITLPLQYRYTGVYLPENSWHKLTIDMRINSSPTVQDGKLRILLDSTVVEDRSNIWYVDPSWGASQKFQAYDWRIGYQLNASAKVDETRYWDNLVFKVKR
jgi:hypothetical protein